MLLVLTNLASVSGVKEKTFVRKHRHRESAPQQATLHADGQIDIARAPSLAPLALGFTTPGGYFKLDFGADQSACGTDLIGSEAECKSGAQAIGIDMEQGMWMGNSPWWHAGTWQGVPKGCWVLNSRAYWNNDNPTNTSEAHNDLPSKQLSAHALDPVKRSRPAQGSLAQVGEQSSEEPVGVHMAQEAKSEGAAYLRQQFAKDSFPICKQSGRPASLDVSALTLGVMPTYYVMEAGTCCCPEYSQIKSESECREAVLGVGIQNLSFSGLNPNLPSGCSAQYGSNGSFNTGTFFDSRGDMLPICKHAFGPAATTGAQFYRMPLGSAACQTSHKISSVEECVGAAGALGLIVVSLESPWVGETEIIPAGCSHQYGGRAHWNKAASGTPRPDMLPCVPGHLQKT